MRFRLPSNPFTVTGRMLGLSAAVTLFVLIDSALAELAAYIFCLLASAFVCGLVFRPRLRLKAEEPSIVLNGQRFMVRVVVENVGRLAAYDLSLSFSGVQPGLRMETSPVDCPAVDSSESVIVEFSGDAVRRGIFPLPTIHVASLFPFGLFRFFSRHDLKTSVTVAPNYLQSDQTAGEATLGFDESEVVGQHRSRGLQEYIGSREFQPGLPVRRWDFASWARLGKPAVREFSEGSDSSILVVVDTLKTANSSVDPNLERVLSKSAGVVAGFDRIGERVHLITMGNQVCYHEDRGTAVQRDFLLTALAAVEGTEEQADWYQFWEDIQFDFPDDSVVVAILNDRNGVAQSSFEDALLAAKGTWRCVLPNREEYPDQTTAAQPIEANG